MIMLNENVCDWSASIAAATESSSCVVQPATAAGGGTAAAAAAADDDGSVLFCECESFAEQQRPDKKPPTSAILGSAGASGFLG